MSLLSYLINGISLGSVYAIIALGYTMVYGIAKMLNFAHGDVIMVGGYVVFVLVSGMGLPPMLAVIVSMVVCTVLGMVIERVAYKPLRMAASPLAVLITAIGVSYLLQNVALLLFRQYQVLYFRGYHSGHFAGRGAADDLRRDDCHNSGLHDNYGDTDTVYQKDQSRAGHAGSIRR